MTQSYATDSFISTRTEYKAKLQHWHTKSWISQEAQHFGPTGGFFLSHEDFLGWLRENGQVAMFLFTGGKQRSLIVFAVNVSINVKLQNRIMETLCLFFIQGILWSSRTNKSWEWHAASAHEEGFSSWRTQGPCVCKQKNELLQEQKKQICCWSHAAVSGVQLAAEGRHSRQRYNSPALFLCAGLMFSLGGKKGKQHFQ